MEKKVLSCLQYVKASDIWPTAKDHFDYGPKEGLLRGYNVQVVNADGTTSWDGAEFISHSIVEELNSEFKQWYYADRGVTPTGRICFRGYAIPSYDDTVILVNDDGEIVRNP